MNYIIYKIRMFVWNSYYYMMDLARESRIVIFTIFGIFYEIFQQNIIWNCTYITKEHKTKDKKFYKFELKDMNQYMVRYSTVQYRTVA